MGQTQPIQWNTYSIILCPKCEEEVPFIDFTKTPNGLKLSISCSCSQNEHKELTLEDYLQAIQAIPKQQTDFNCSSLIHNEKADRYCIDCSTSKCKLCLEVHDKTYPSHHLINHPINIQCKLHYKDYDYYCNKCYVNICEDCQPSHTSHQLIHIGKADITSFQKDINLIDYLIQRNTQIKEDFIERLNIAIAKEKIPKGNQWKKDIESLYEINNKNNLLLKLYSQCLYKTASLLKNHLNYALMNLLENIRINIRDINSDENSLEKSYVLMKNYFLDNYIIIIENKANGGDGVLPKEDEKIVLIDNIVQEEQYLLGHDDAIKALLLLNDNTIASGSFDCNIRIWEITTVKTLFILEGHTNTVCCLYQLHNGLLASGSKDSTIRLWNTTKGSLEHTLKGHQSQVNCITQLLNNTIVSGSSDKTMRFWDMKTMACIKTLSDYNESIYSMIVLSDGSLVSGQYDRTIKYWSTKTFYCIETLKGHSECISCLLELRSGALISGSYDNTIRIWNNQSYKCIGIFEEHLADVLCMVQLTEEYIASGSLDNKIIIWSIKNLISIHTFIAHSESVNCLLYYPEKRLLSGGDDNIIKIFKI